MDKQFQYITELAKKYRELSDHPAKLYKEINELPLKLFEHILSEYGDPTNKFQPVNLLRAEIARNKLLGEEISVKKVEFLKDKIRKKELGYFSHFPQPFLQEFDDYTITKRDMFTNWKNPWSIFYVYFYSNKSGAEKETVQKYLNDIGQDLLLKLDISDYTFHTVDFQGPNNFGSTYCWVALYPVTKDSHMDSYQLFLKIGDESQAGIYAGKFIEESVTSLKRVRTYSEVVKQLESVKIQVIKSNKATRNYFKFAPGAQASAWKEFYENGIAAISYRHLINISLEKANSLAELNKLAGLPSDDRSNQSMNLWLFKSANIGDVLFASKGTNTCIGIGIIEGDYYFDKDRTEYNHIRKVNWITDKIYQYKSGTYKNKKKVFRPDTFSPTKMHSFLIEEYVRLYPELIDVFNKYKLIPGSNSTNLANSDKEQSIEINSEESEDINFWWLNANPKIWSISDHQEGQRQTYTTHNEKGNKRRIYKYFEKAKPGDLIIGYESTPTKQIKAIYEISKGIHTTNQGEEIEFELVEKLNFPVHWNELKNNRLLENCEVFNNNQGSLLKLTEEEYDVIRDIIDNKNIITTKLLGSTESNKYNFQNDPDKPFITALEFSRIVKLLTRKKNIILQGPPGVGKTFLARKIAYEIIEEISPTNIEVVQFHQSYSYEDFIQGLRPTQKGGFEIKEGVFYLFCQRALAHPDKPFFLIIDEINRGNLSKIFGELLMLIEHDKRDKQNALKLTYAEDEEDKFYVPNNLYIIGTMNTADRSLAIVDYALRRRFAFVPLKPDFGDSFTQFLKEKGLSSSLIQHICSAVNRVNSKIKEDINLGDGFQIGHSYFCSYSSKEDENQWWEDILNFEIKPLIEELWFDDTSKVEEALKEFSR